MKSLDATRWRHVNWELALAMFESALKWMKQV